MDTFTARTTVQHRLPQPVRVHRLDRLSALIAPALAAALALVGCGGGAPPAISRTEGVQASGQAPAPERWCDVYYTGAGAPTLALPKVEPARPGGLPVLDTGHWVWVNLWATWCAPCRGEMPALDRLQSALGSDKFEVVALAIDKSGLAGARKFLDETKAQKLKLYADPTARLGNEFKVVGMPTSILIDKEGHEVGRLIGPAEWDSPEAKRLIQSLL